MRDISHVIACFCFAYGSDVGLFYEQVVFCMRSCLCLYCFALAIAAHDAVLRELMIVLIWFCVTCGSDAVFLCELVMFCVLVVVLTWFCVACRSNVGIASFCASLWLCPYSFMSLVMLSV